MTKTTFDPIHFRLTHPIRLGIMLFLFLCFFIASPIVVLYTMGYRYDTKTSTLKTTGVITVDILPRDATIHINDIQLHGRPPYRLTNRAPGVYSLLIEKDGYFPLSKNILVESNKTTYIHEFSLIKDSEPTELFFEGTVLEVHGTPSTGGAIVHVQSEDGAIHVMLIEPESERRIVLYSSKTNPITTVSPYTSLVLIQDPESNTSHLFSANRPEQNQISFPTPKSTQWSKSDESLYSYNNSVLQHIDINGRTRTLSTTTQDWFVEYPETVWITDDHVVSLEKDKNTAYSLPGGTWNTLDVTRERIIVFDELAQKAAVLYRDGREQSVSFIDAQKFFYEESTDIWWLWNEFEMRSIDNKGAVTLFERYGSSIKNFMPFDEDGLKLIIGKDSMFAHLPTSFPRQTLLENSTTWESTFPSQRIMLYTTKSEKGIHLFKKEY